MAQHALCFTSQGRSHWRVACSDLQQGWVTELLSRLLHDNLFAVTDVDRLAMEILPQAHCESCQNFAEICRRSGGPRSRRSCQHQKQAAQRTQLLSAASSHRHSKGVSHEKPPLLQWQICGVHFLKSTVHVFSLTFMHLEIASVLKIS